MWQTLFPSSSNSSNNGRRLAKSTPVPALNAQQVKRTDQNNAVPASALSTVKPTEPVELAAPQSATKNHAAGNGLWQRLFPKSDSARTAQQQHVKSQNNKANAIAFAEADQIDQKILNSATLTPATPSQISTAPQPVVKPSFWSKWTSNDAADRKVAATAPQLVLSAVLTPVVVQPVNVKPSAVVQPVKPSKSLWQRLFPTSSAVTTDTTTDQKLKTQAIDSSKMAAQPLAESKIETNLSANDNAKPVAASVQSLQSSDLASPDQSASLPDQHLSLWQRWFAKPSAKATVNKADATIPKANSPEASNAKAVVLDLPQAQTVSGGSESLAAPKMVASTPVQPRKSVWDILFPKANTTQGIPDKTPVATVKPELALRRELDGTTQSESVTVQPSGKMKSWWRNPFAKSNTETTQNSIQFATVDTTTAATDASATSTAVIQKVSAEPVDVQSDVAKPEILKSQKSALQKPVLSNNLSLTSATPKQTVWQRLFPSQQTAKRDQVAALSANTTQVKSATERLKQSEIASASSNTSNVDLAVAAETQASANNKPRKSFWQILFPTTSKQANSATTSATPVDSVVVTKAADSVPTNNQVSATPVSTYTATPASAAPAEITIQPQAPVLNTTPDSNEVVTQTFNLAASPKTLKTKAAKKAKQKTTPQAEPQNNTLPTVAVDAPKSAALNENQAASNDYTVLQNTTENQSWNLAPKSSLKVKAEAPTDTSYNSWMIEPRPSFGERVWDQTRNFEGLLAPQPNDRFRYLDIQKLSNFNFEAPANDRISAAPAVQYNSNQGAVNRSASNAGVTMPDEGSNVSAVQSAMLMQPRMNISDVVRMAVVRHPQIAQSISQLAAQNANIDIAKSQYYPQLSTGIATGDLTSSERGRQQLTLNLQQALFDFGKIKTNVNTEQAKLQVQQANVLVNIDDIAFKVASAIISIKRFQAVSDIAQQQVEGTKRILDIAKLRAQAGISSQADPVQAQTYLESAQSNLIAQVSLLRENQQRLRTLVGVDLSRKDFDIPDDLVQVSDLYQEPEFNKIPNMILAQAQVEVAKSQRKETELSRYPTLSVRGSVSQSLNGRNPDNNANNSTSSAILLEASSNFYQGGLTSSQVKSAGFAEQAAKAAVNSVYLDVLDKIRTYREQIENKQEQIKVLVDRQQSTIRTRELYQEQYKLGTRTVLDLLNAEQAIHASNTELQNARYDIYDNLIQYIATTGHSRDAYDLNSLSIQGVEIQP